MEEISFLQLLNYFKSKFMYIILSIALFFCLSCIYVNKLMTPMYSSYTTILLNQSQENATISSSDINLNNSLSSTYAEIIKSKRVLRTTIDNLRLDYEYKELLEMVSVSEVTDTQLIKITVTNEDARLSSQIANEIAQVFSKEIVEIYNIENLSIIDEAEISQVASSASAFKIIMLSSIGGMFFAIAIIFIVFYFDKTIKNEEDIEKLTGLPVIGIVPVSHGKEKRGKKTKPKDEILLPISKQ